MSTELHDIPVNELFDVTDYVANGSFAALKDNVTYKSAPDYAVVVRLVDHNSGWQGERIYVSESAYKFLSKSSVQPGDVIISNVGANAGTVFQAPDLGRPMTLGPNSILLKPKQQMPCLREFAYYFYSSYLGQTILKSIVSGSAQPKFNKTDFRRTQILVPKRYDFSSIVAPLKSLDDKIQLNHQINQTLEQMAQAIFKSWFVDFEPVKAKIAALED
ncbi:MAG: restriction endonuclease subunit S, partial [Marinobacter sp.]|uniref:restriction endonuclease subunit S n=1 Tax=Marinobacter sp. TaxID=50741 RepID=UPI003C68B55B